MKTDKRKIVIVGTGMVGMSYAYCLLNQSVCDELVLIDVDKKRAEGEAMDLNHGLAFAGSSMKIYAGEYKACQDADLVVISDDYQTQVTYAEGRKVYDRSTEGKIFNADYLNR